MFFSRTNSSWSSEDDWTNMWRQLDCFEALGRQHIIREWRWSKALEHSFANRFAATCGVKLRIMSGSIALIPSDARFAGKYVQGYWIWDHRLALPSAHFGAAVWKLESVCRKKGRYKKSVALFRGVLFTSKPTMRRSTSHSCSVLISSFAFFFWVNDWKLPRRWLTKDFTRF